MGQAIVWSGSRQSRRDAATYERALFPREKQLENEHNNDYRTLVSVALAGSSWWIPPALRLAISIRASQSEPTISRDPTDRREPQENSNLD